MKNAVHLALIGLAACATMSAQEKKDEALKTAGCEQFKNDPRNKARFVQERPYYTCMLGILPQDVESFIASGGVPVKGIRVESLLAYMHEPPTTILDGGNGTVRMSWHTDSPGYGVSSLTATVLNDVVTNIARSYISTR